MIRLPSHADGKKDATIRLRVKACKKWLGLTHRPLSRSCLWFIFRIL